MPDITNYDGRLEQMAYYCEQMLDNIAKVNNAYHDSVETAYAAALPDDLIKWKNVNQIGGKTIAWNQLVDTGTTTVDTISGRKYYKLIDGTESIITGDGTAITVVDDTADMVVDLTLCFGNGNEPATTSAFKEIFPADHYPYNEGTLLSAEITEAISKDSSDNVLQTYEIPAEVKTLPGYGWSAGDVYNYVDFERKVFVQNVGSVDLGSLTWNYQSGNTRFAANTPADAASSIPGGIPCVCAKYESYRNRQVAFVSADKAVLVNSSFHDGVKILIKDSSYTDATTFTSAVNGTYLFYKLQTPVETDISEYLTDENITKAESGGSIVFPNSHGDDYQIPVPVQLEYIGV